MTTATPPAAPATEHELAGLTIPQLDAIIGGLSKPSKMPGYGYSLPARECATGSKLRAVQGSTCSGCYAMKGRYVFPTVQAALYRRYASLQDPRWIPAMAERIRRTRNEWFRWHDSGDLQSVEHLAAICAVAELTPNVRHWLPTREYRMVADYRRAGGQIPENLTVRMSAHMVGGHVPTFGAPLTVSTVSTSDDSYPDAHACPARFQGNKCLDCRACWSRDVAHVDYHAH